MVILGLLTFFILVNPYKPLSLIPFEKIGMLNLSVFVFEKLFLGTSPPLAEQKLFTNYRLVVLSCQFFLGLLNLTVGGSFAIKFFGVG